MQVPLTEKQPAERLMPLLNVDVAAPDTSSFKIVVEPVDESSARKLVVDVPNVVTDDVAMYNVLLIARKLNGLFVDEPSVSASCGPVDVAMVRRTSVLGVVVPILIAADERAEPEPSIPLPKIALPMFN
jgi:hypothetical protein